MAGIVDSASGTTRLPPSRTKSFCMSTTISAVRAASMRTSSATSYSGTSIAALMPGSSRGGDRRRLRRDAGSSARDVAADAQQARAAEDRGQPELEDPVGEHGGGRHPERRAVGDEHADEP